VVFAATTRIEWFGGLPASRSCPVPPARPTRPPR